jgi:probable rRNA maturation factor
MEPPSSRNITVLNQSERKLRTAHLRRAASLALARHGLSDANVCVLLTDDQHIRELNARFRGMDEPTDVLTFPSGLPDPLGDIAISVEYAQRQAEARGVSLSQELGYLAIHGALHLAGLDDEEEAQRAHMVREMNAVAVEVGLKPDEAWASILHEERP